MRVAIHIPRMLPDHDLHFRFVHVTSHVFCYRASALTGPARSVDPEKDVARSCVLKERCRLLHRVSLSTGAIFFRNLRAGSDGAAPHSSRTRHHHSTHTARRKNRAICLLSKRDRNVTHFRTFGVA
jgi:hypothetical protein